MIRRFKRRFKRKVISGIYEPTHRYYGFFPTTNILKVLPLLDGNDSVDILKVRGKRAVYRKTKEKRVLPYLTVIDLDEQSVDLQFDSIKHGKLPAGKVMRTMGDIKTDLMAVDELDVMLPGDRIPIHSLSPRGIYKSKRKAPVVAMLRSHCLHEQFEKDSEYKKVLEPKSRDGPGYITDEELAKGLVRASLDLMYLQDYGCWSEGSRVGYYTPRGMLKGEYAQPEDYKMGVTEDVEVVERVMGTIDPQRFLRHIRAYERGSGNVWKLTKVW